MAMGSKTDLPGISNIVMIDNKAATSKTIVVASLNCSTSNEKKLFLFFSDKLFEPYFSSRILTCSLDNPVLAFESSCFKTSSFDELCQIILSYLYSAEIIK